MLQLKHRILQDLFAHNIKTFAPSFDDKDDSKYIAQLKALERFQPFAIVGALYSRDSEPGKNSVNSRQRVYPWGVVEVDQCPAVPASPPPTEIRSDLDVADQGQEFLDNFHCSRDFLLLLGILIQHCYISLVQQTDVFYGIFRNEYSKVMLEQAASIGTVTEAQLAKLKQSKEEKQQQLQTLAKSLKTDREQAFRAKADLITNKAREILDSLEEEKTELLQHLEASKSRSTHTADRERRHITSPIGSYH
jgi:septin family protein